MSIGALFGLSVAMSFIASGIIAWLFVWPRLVVPHTFRFVGLSFLVPGVVSPSLAPAFAACGLRRSRRCYPSDCRGL